MKRLIEIMVRRRNPDFEMHERINSLAIVSFLWNNAWSVFRGLVWILYGKKPKMSILGKGVNFFNTPKIKFGRFLKLGDYVFVSALGRGHVRFGHNTSIGAFGRVVLSTTFQNPGAFIHIGNNVGIGEFAYLGGGGGLEIGNDCIVGQYFSCHPENHLTHDVDTLIRHQGVVRQGIKIGSNCWIGSKVTILDGVQIGDGCIIAAGSVVNRSFGANSVIAGVPAKLIKIRA